MVAIEFWQNLPPEARDLFVVEWGRANALQALTALSQIQGEPYVVRRLLALARDEGVNDNIRVLAVWALDRLNQTDALLTLALDEGVDARL